MEITEAFYDLTFEELKDEEIFQLLPSKINKDKIKSRIGYGSEGIIYEYDNDKIIKINLDPRVNKNNFFEICEYVKNNKPLHIMDICDFGEILDGKFLWYIGERLLPLKKYEMNEIEYNCDRYHRFITEEKPFKIYKTKTQRINNFWQFLSEFTYKHIDLWYANIMRDESLNIKVIDLEGFVEQCQ